MIYRQSTDSSPSLVTHIRIHTGRHVDLVQVNIELRMTSQVRAHHELREHLIFDRVDRILDHAEHVETRQNRFRELHVLLERYRGVVSPSNWVSRSNNSTSGLQRGDDTRFGDRNRLLLHCLVNRCSVRIVHLVELVDQAVAFIGQYKCTTLKRPFARHWVFADRSGQTDSGSTLTGGEDRSRRRLFNVLEELRFGGTGITEKKDVDVSSDSVLSVDVFHDTTEERERQRGLDVLVTVDGGSDRLDDTLRDSVVLRHGSNLLLVLLGQSNSREQVLFLVDMVGFEHGREDGEPVFGVQRGVEVVSVDTGDFLRVSASHPSRVALYSRPPLPAWPHRSNPTAG